jgi:hypothetical protein
MTSRCDIDGEFDKLPDRLEGVLKTMRKIAKIAVKKG